MKIDGEIEVLSFDPAALQVVNANATGDLEEVLKSIKKGAEARAVYTVDGNVKRVSLLTLKPKLKVAAEKQVTTEQLEKLVAMGPEKGKYFLFDARPAPKYAEGYIPTAENLPFPAFEKEKGKLPADKSALVIFYCQGVTCAMSPAARDAAEALGYTNAKVYHEGIPVWTKTRALSLSPKLLQEAWIAKGQPAIVLDARKKTAGGVIAGAAAFPKASKEALDKLYRFRKMKPPIVVYDADGASNAPEVAKAIVAAGIPRWSSPAGSRPGRPPATPSPRCTRGRDRLRAEAEGGGAADRGVQGARRRHAGRHGDPRRPERGRAGGRRLQGLGPHPGGPGREPHGRPPEGQADRHPLLHRSAGGDGLQRPQDRRVRARRVPRHDRRVRRRRAGDWRVAPEPLMKKIIQAAVLAFAVVLATASTARAEEKVNGTVTKLEVAKDKKSAVAVLKDNETAKLVPVTIVDDVTLQKFERSVSRSATTSSAGSRSRATRTSPSTSRRPAAADVRLNGT